MLSEKAWKFEAVLGLIGGLFLSVAGGMICVLILGPLLKDAPKDTQGFVAFLVSADGYFRVSDYRNGVWIDQVPWTTWPHIRRDGAPNLLRAECRGETCAFFVNDEWTWQAESIPATAQVGVVAAGAEALFDQFALGLP